ncbi:aminotransferase V [Pandoraea cepalis]|uniref:Aminotransferase V n=1 Tax=Pandoraea cepalis TaxID=2508294 RepID=A0A5E4VXC2_9BURK|nr:aminotransferase class V-fold PLP-dependent enzyme [Pandoraea cepalis]VVE16493.1 aminotransferase V [Pandoraea cepalis]
MQSQYGDDDFGGWLLYHSVGAWPGRQTQIAAALSEFAREWCAPDDRHWASALASKQALLADLTTLIGAPPHQVSQWYTAQNVTDALHRFLDALGPARLAGRTILVAADAFPSLHFLLSGLASRYGYALRTVPLRPNAHYLHDDDFVDAWSDDVALAVVTWVSSLTSKRVDLPRLVAHAHSRHSLLALDVTQGLGIVPFDIVQTPVDFLCGSTLKWLGGVPGAGVAWISPSLDIDALAPAARGWFSQGNPFNWDLDRFAFAPDARRLDTGTPSVLPFLASRPGVRWLLDQPPGALRAHNRALCDAIIEMSDRLGIALLSPRDPSMRGGSVMLGLPARTDPQSLIAALAAHHVHADVRGTTLRLSPGPCTTMSGVQRMAHVLSGAPSGVAARAVQGTGT